MDVPSLAVGSPTIHPLAVPVGVMPTFPRNFSASLMPAVSQPIIQLFSYLPQQMPQMPHTRLGERVLIPVDPLKKWLQERSQAEMDASRRSAAEILKALDSSR